ncbi:MAG: cellulase, partial [Sphingobacteriia bacterium]
APQWLFNQLGDDRDHMGMRIPKEDTYYGRGFERPVYFVNGLPQQRGKFMNATTGTSSTAAKYSAAFSLAARLLPGDPMAGDPMALLYRERSRTALAFALRQPGVTQTASVRSPYIYAEENWTDDMEWAFAAQAPDDPAARSQAFLYAQMEKMTPWLGRDTAAHYQWYPFVNMGHAELLRTAVGRQRDSLLHWYKKGIQAVAQKAHSNAFNRGIPFIWCSNNLTVAFALQCYWYRQASGDPSFQALEQACLDWVLGMNPWGTSMVVGLPQTGDHPIDPHSAFTHLKNYPIYGGLVDGPVYASIFNGLIGIQLKDADEYVAFQSPLAVYHDDYGDYSTNEPTLDGTAVLTYLLAAQEAQGKKPAPRAAHGLWQNGALVRAASKQKLALVFTADEFTEGLDTIMKALRAEKIPAGFFFTGRAYRSPAVAPKVSRLQAEGHLLGPHSDQHLLYNDWNRRDSLLVSYAAFKKDLDQNRKSMDSLGIAWATQRYFIPPYEWWNDSIATWSAWEGLQLFSFTPGTRTNADYTWPDMGKAYRSSSSLLQAMTEASAQPKNFSGSILLVHAGTDPRRKDKFYLRLREMIRLLRNKGYVFERVDRLLEE